MAGFPQAHASRSSRSGFKATSVLSESAVQCCEWWRGFSVVKCWSRRPSLVTMNLSLYWWEQDVDLVVKTWELARCDGFGCRSRNELLTCWCVSWLVVANGVQLEACVHPFFDELRDPNCRLPSGRPLPPLFNFKRQGVILCCVFRLSWALKF